jgi:hypothetical protein
MSTSGAEELVDLAVQKRAQIEDQFLLGSSARLGQLRHQPHQRCSVGQQQGREIDGSPVLSIRRDVDGDDLVQPGKRRLERQPLFGLEVGRIKSGIEVDESVSDGTRAGVHACDRILRATTSNERASLSERSKQPIQEIAHRGGMSTSDLFVTVRPFIASAVARTVRRTAYSNAELHHACSRLILFVGAETHLKLTDATVFAAPTIEKYIATLTDMTPASRGNLRSVLYRMSEVLLGTTGKGDLSYTLSAASPSEPYSDAEVAALNVWFSAQGDRQVDAAALFGLGFGTGLSSAEIVAVKPSDVEVESAGETASVVVTVRGVRHRAVVVDDAYARFVLAAWRPRQMGKWLFAPAREGAGKNLISNFVSRGASEGLRPNTQRMRATYLVRHIEAGDSVVELMRIAGVKSLDALGRYVRFVG